MPAEPVTLSVVRVEGAFALDLATGSAGVPASERCRACCIQPDVAALLSQVQHHPQPTAVAYFRALANEGRSTKRTT